MALLIYKTKNSIILLFDIKIDGNLKFIVAVNNMCLTQPKKQKKQSDSLCPIFQSVSESQLATPLPSPTHD